MGFVAPLSAVVLTYNEETNLPTLLASLEGCATEIFVVDSGSTDRTREIAEAAGCRVFLHEFTTHAAQWAWTLGELPLSCPWILALDADQALTRDLREEIASVLGPDGSRCAGVDGFFFRRKQVFRGRWIRWGGYGGKSLLKLFRREAAAVGASDLVDHHFRVTGRTAKMSAPLIEWNRKEDRISFFLEKHLRYARLQACEELGSRLGDTASARGRFFGTPDERVLWMKSLWGKSPLLWRSVGYFVFRYVLLLGFLDGREGFLFHFFQALWYRLLVDVELEEQLKGREAEG